VKENLKIIFFFLLISLLPLIFYFNIYLLYPLEFDANFILQKNFVWDEKTIYFKIVYNFLIYKSFGVSEINNAFKFSSIPISIILLSIIKILFGYNYFPIFLDVILSLGFLVITYFFLKNFLKIDKLYSFLFSIFFLITFSKGPTTLIFFLQILKDLNLDSMPHIFRQISPSLTSIFLILFIIINVKYFQSLKNNTYLILLPIFYFVYPFNTLIQITGSFIFSFYFFLKKKYQKKKIILFFFVNFFSFLIWFLLNSLESDWFSKYLLGANYDLIFDQRNYFLLFFIFLNFIFFYFFKLEKFIYLNLAFLAIFVVYNVKFLLGYDLQFYHVDMYFSKPLQWINIFLIVNTFFYKLYFKRIITISIVLFVILFCLSFNNYSKKILNQNKEYLTSQIQFKKDLFKIKNKLKNKTIVTLDPNFIFYGYSYTNSKNFIFYSARNINVSPEINVKRFIYTCVLHGIFDKNTMISIFSSNFGDYKYGLHGAFHELIFLEDGPAGGNINNPYRSIKKEKKFENLEEIISSYYSDKLKEDLSDETIILVNKLGTYNYEMNLKELNLIFENDTFQLYKILAN